MNINYALYYPTIEFSNQEWLWNACLLWDRIYRIVPDNYKPNDVADVQWLVENSDVIGNINPEPYATKATDEFLRAIQERKWACAALNGMDYDDDYVRLHASKTDVQLRKLLPQSRKDENFYRVPRTFANAYMIYLANRIATDNNLSLSTDSDFSWICSNYYDYDGKIEEQNNLGFLQDSATPLAALTFSEFLPFGVSELSPSALLAFRERSTDERKLFFSEISSFSKKLETIKDPTVVRDVIQDSIEELKRSKEEYEKRMHDIKVQSFFGVKTMVFPVISSVASALLDLPTEVVAAMTLCGVCCGIVGNIYETEGKLKAERAKHKANYLMEMSMEMPYYYQYPSYLNKDFTRAMFYQMHINDRLNEFIND